MLNWIASMNWMAQLTFLLAVISVFGIALGKLNFKGLSLGIGGVLFAGIFVSHFAFNYNLGFDLNKPEFESARHYIQEFGLILFVYAIGISVGPSFFASLRSSGIKLISLAVGVVALGFIVTFVIFKTADVKVSELLGIYSGAVTNTPALGASNQIISEVVQSGSAGNYVDVMVPDVSEIQAKAGGDASALTAELVKKASSTINSGYAVAYPFGILGIFITYLLIKMFFRINVAEEGAKFDREKNRHRQSLETMNVRITNKNLIGIAISQVPDFAAENITCSRLKRGNSMLVPKPELVLQENDILHLVGSRELLNRAVLNIGEEVNVSLSTKGTDFAANRIIVTNDKAFGKTIEELCITKLYNVVISRFMRAGVELVASEHTQLQFGDSVMVVGSKADIDEVVKILGDSKNKLQQVNPLPLFLGVALGIILGYIAIPIPGVPSALKLGIAGGPLVMAIFLSRFGSTWTRGKMYWFMPRSANAAIKEIGIVLFLAAVGLNAGRNFVASVTSSDGLYWLMWGAMITFIPVMTMALIGRLFLKVNYLSLCGTLAGACTDPPALAYSNSMHTNAEASSLAYATVYPFSMFLRILSPQLFVILIMMVS